MFSEKIGEGFVRQFLDGRHPVAPQLLQFVESIVVEGDQFAHVFSAPPLVQWPLTAIVPARPEQCNGSNVCWLAGKISAAPAAVIWTLWEIEQTSKPRRNGDRFG